MLAVEIKSDAGCPKDWVRGAIIGAGAFGTVSLAIDKSKGELFAVKSMAGNSISYLENEYNILRALDSPYIVRCLGKENSIENGVDTCNLMMEYMPGGSVASLLSKFGGHLDESVIRAYTGGILRGLDYLHKQGIVHCDVKGNNVLVGAAGVVKLGDFGSARNTDDKGLSLQHLRGTPLWMAPEVVNQLGQGPPSDIWSLGCTMVEMATGRPPWSSVSNPLAAMYRIGCTDELPDLPMCLSSEGRDFLEKCFRRDPKKMWTAEQLLNHPFLHQTDCCSAMEVKKAPGSPISTLDCASPDWDSSSSSLSGTVPILSLGISRPCGKVNAGEGEESIKRQRPSSRDRLSALAAGGERPDWCARSPTGQWMVVRFNSPLSNTPLLTKNYSSSVESTCNSGLESSDREKQQFTNRRSAAKTSGEECQYECNEQSSRPITELMILAQAQELCKQSCGCIAEFHNRALGRDILCVSANQSTQNWGPSRVLCIRQRWPKMFMNSKASMCYTAKTPNFISQLILIHIILLPFFTFILYEGFSRNDVLFVLREFSILRITRFLF